MAGSLGSTLCIMGAVCATAVAFEYLTTEPSPLPNQNGNNTDTSRINQLALNRIRTIGANWRRILAPYYEILQPYYRIVHPFPRTTPAQVCIIIVLFFKILGHFVSFSEQKTKNLYSIKTGNTVPQRFHNNLHLWIYRCRLSRQPSIDLVRDPTENNAIILYDRIAITEWLKNHETSPVTGKPLKWHELRNEYIVSKRAQRCVQRLLKQEAQSPVTDDGD